MGTVGSKTNAPQPQAKPADEKGIMTPKTQQEIVDLVKPFLSEGEPVKAGLDRILKEYASYNVAAKAGTAAGSKKK